MKSAPIEIQESAKKAAPDAGVSTVETCGLCGVEARSFLTEYVAENGTIKGQVCSVDKNYFHPEK